MSRTEREHEHRRHQLNGYLSYCLREVEIQKMVPSLYQVESTSICNLRCVFCPQDEMTRTAGHMDFFNFHGFLKEQCSHVKHVVFHHFGEPFLNRELPSYIQACRDLNVTTSVSTNATRMPEDLVDRVLESGLTRIVFSLDGARADSFEKLRRGAKYSQVVANIEMFLKKKSELKKGPFVVLQFIVTPENEGEKEDFQKLWLGRPGVDQIVFKSETTHAGQRVRRDDYRPKNEGTRMPCLYLWSSVVILADGSIVPCCADYDGKEILGNVFRGDRLEDVWNSPRMLELRKLHIESRFNEIELCKNCREWTGHEPMPVAKAMENYVASEKRLARFFHDAKILHKETKWSGEF